MAIQRRTSLLTRLRPKYVLGLKANEEKWEYAVNRIRERLDDCIFYSQLTISEIDSLRVMSDQRGDRDQNDWKWGADIFFTEKDVA